MKKNWRTVALAGFLAAAGGTSAFGQQADHIVQFRAPFAFQIEDTKLPAGEYTILEESGWVQIQTKEGKNVAHVLTLRVTSENGKPVDASQVVFHNYAGRLFLAQIWATGQERGRELLVTREEQQLARREKMAAVKVPAATRSGK